MRSGIYGVYSEGRERPSLLRGQRLEASRSATTARQRSGPGGSALARPRRTRSSTCQYQSTPDRSKLAAVVYDTAAVVYDTTVRVSAARGWDIASGEPRSPPPRIDGSYVRRH
jgi:hypothetical protein